MAFKKKAKNVNGNGGSSNGFKPDWDAFNQHLLEEIGDEEPRIAYISGLIDTGIHQYENSEYEYKGEERQDKLIEAGKAELSDDGETLIVYGKLVDTVVITVDFPDTMINYGKYFTEEGEDDFKPYRGLLRGEFYMKSIGKSMAQYTPLTVKYDEKSDTNWAYDGKSIIYKLARATGLVPKGVVDSDFEVGDLLGESLTLTLGAEENGKYVNIKIKDPTKTMKGVSVPDLPVEPFGISMDGGNSEEELKNINAKIRATLELSTNFEGSKLQKEMQDLWNKSAPKKSSAKSEDEEEPKTKKSVKKTTDKKAPAKKNTKKVEPNLEEEDFSDDIPF